MLRKISCSLFNEGEISFNNGLNIILGDNDAKNSIGKSSALMAVDFAMGGNSLLKDKAGVINALGHHSYKFEFEFNGDFFFFIRETDSANVIKKCNRSFENIDEISIDSYTEWLKLSYGLDQMSSSFRNIIGPFSRVWNKGELDPEHPFSGDSKESAVIAINRLIDLFELSGEIAEEKSILDSYVKKKSIITKSMNADVIPNINKTKYKSNQKVISNNSSAIDELKTDFNGALTAYEALFDADLRMLQQKKNELSYKKNSLLVRETRIQHDLTGFTPKLAANIALIQEFIPHVNVERLKKVEEFHHKISTLVGNELKKDLAKLKEEISAITDEMSEIDKKISTSLAEKGTPNDLFQRVFELKEIIDKATLENHYFDTKAATIEQVKITQERLNMIYDQIFLIIEKKINFKLSNFNKVVYGPTRNASQLRLKSEKSYSFISPEDTGTGKSYAGLVGFDLAMVSLTKLPFIIHDSIIYKNIEVPATRNILRILANIKKKQIFLAFDEASKFGNNAEKLLLNHSILKLSDNSLLYTRDWREKSSSK